MVAASISSIFLILFSRTFITLSSTSLECLKVFIVLLTTALISGIDIINNMYKSNDVSIPLIIFLCLLISSLISSSLKISSPTASINVLQSVFTISPREESPCIIFLTPIICVQACLYQLPLKFPFEVKLSKVELIFSVASVTLEIPFNMLSHCIFMH